MLIYNKERGDFVAGKSLKEVMKGVGVEEYSSTEEINLPVEIEIADASKLDKHKSYTDINLVKFGHYFIQGCTERELADAFGISVVTVKKIKQSDEFKAVLKTVSHEITEVARVFMASAGIKAVRTLIDCLESSSDKIRLGASTQILDRIGLKAPEKIELIAKSDAIQQMSDEQLMELVKMGIDEILPNRIEDRYDEAT